MNYTVDRYGNKRWFNENIQLHRMDGPAKIMKYGFQYWFINGRALTRREVTYWYINQGIKIEDFNKSLTSDEQILFKLKFG